MAMPSWPKAKARSSHRRASARELDRADLAVHGLPIRGESARAEGAFNNPFHHLRHVGHLLRGRKHLRGGRKAGILVRKAARGTMAVLLYAGEIRR
jgi:hypothetical protein